MRATNLKNPGKIPGAVKLKDFWLDPEMEGGVERVCLGLSHSLWVAQLFADAHVTGLQLPSGIKERLWVDRDTLSIANDDLAAPGVLGNDEEELSEIIRDILTQAHAHELIPPDGQQPRSAAQWVRLLASPQKDLMDCCELSSGRTSFGTPFSLNGFRAKDRPVPLTRKKQGLSPPMKPRRNFNVITICFRKPCALIGRSAGSMLLAGRRISDLVFRAAERRKAPVVGTLLVLSLVLAAYVAHPYIITHLKDILGGDQSIPTTPLPEKKKVETKEEPPVAPPSPEITEPAPRSGNRKKVRQTSIPAVPVAKKEPLQKPIKVVNENQTEISAKVSKPTSDKAISDPEIQRVPIPPEPTPPVAENSLQAKLKWGAGRKTVALNLTRYGTRVSLELVRLNTGSYIQGKGNKFVPNGREISIQEPFYMGVTEVVQKAYYMVMANETKSKESDSLLPMNWLSWKNAHDFCTKLNEALADPQFVVRLPWEFEWEYGASQLPMINVKNIEQYAVVKPMRPQKVKTKKPNNVGLHDMLGNLEEWVADYFVENAYMYDTIRYDSPRALRVVRGGSTFDESEKVTASFRRGRKPDAAGRQLGFRIVLAPKSGGDPKILSRPHK